jgi:hypothetical protein
MRGAWHVARMVERRGVYWVLVGKPEGNRLLGRPRRRSPCIQIIFNSSFGLLMNWYPQSFLAVFFIFASFFIFSFIFDLFLALRNNHLLSFSHCALLTGKIQMLFFSSQLFNGLWHILKKLFKMPFLSLCLMLQTFIIIPLYLYSDLSHLL